MPLGQRQWLLLFFDRLASLMTKDFGLRAEVFLQYKALHPNVVNLFLSTAQELCPIAGLARRPGAQIPDMPSPEECTRLMREIMQGGSFDLRDHLADYTYWFLEGADQRERELFLGYGGMTMIFLKPDPKTAPPKLMMAEAMRKHPISQICDPERLYARGFRMLDGFLPKSKELFGAGLESSPQFPGLRFVLPLLRTGDFFSQSDKDTANLFQLCEIYVNESPPDKGVLLATKNDYEEAVIGLLAQMKQEGLVYTER
jgi:hypothetical protein